MVIHDQGRITIREIIKIQDEYIQWEGEYIPDTYRRREWNNATQTT